MNFNTHRPLFCKRLLINNHGDHHIHHDGRGRNACDVRDTQLNNLVKLQMPVTALQLLLKYAFS